MTACDTCDGSGWRTVTEKYAQAQADQAMPRVEGVEWTDAHQARWQSAFASARNTVYPCKVCNADTFWRWANGHFARDHDRVGCPECDTPRGSKRKRPSRIGEQPPPPAEPPPAHDDLESLNR